MSELKVTLRHELKDPKRPDHFDVTAIATMGLGAELEGWDLRAEFLLVDGQVIHGPLTVSPSDQVPFGTLSSKAQRRLNLSPSLLNDIADCLRLLDARGAYGAGEWVDALSAGRRPGQRGQDPIVYVTWAQRRVRAEQAQPGSPIKWMVEKWGHLYSEQSINKYVYMAREKGFLTPAGEPVALTRQARRMLGAQWRFEGELSKERGN